MRLASFEHQGRAAYGVISGSDVIDLTAVRDWPYPDLRSLLGGWSPEVRAGIANCVAPCIPLSEVRWRPVIPNPDKIICVGLNYHSHAAETSRTASDYPVLFLRLANCQIGHLQPLTCPAVSRQLDFEGEIAVIIGQGGRHIAPATALGHVAGYSIYNEASVRDWQHHTHQFTAGKNFMGTGAFGPWLVTTDEIPEPRDLSLVTRLNGRIMQQGNVAELMFSIEQLITYISTMTALVAGDVIVTGTPAGVGALRKPPVWMQEGDIVEVEVSQIGVLRNPVQHEALPT
jgi:2-keto-4-pentenoate hydratase/2-oxohepta-3-ene-1,7-dioic acid hydratase in catechol pathway